MTRTEIQISYIKASEGNGALRILAVDSSSGSPKNWRQRAHRSLVWSARAASMSGCAAIEAAKIKKNRWALSKRKVWERRPRFKAPNMHEISRHGWCQEHVCLAQPRDNTKPIPHMVQSGQQLNKLYYICSVVYSSYMTWSGWWHVTKSCLLPTSFRFRRAARRSAGTQLAAKLLFWRSHWLRIYVLACLPPQATWHESDLCHGCHPLAMFALLKLWHLERQQQTIPHS